MTPSLCRSNRLPRCGGRSVRSTHALALQESALQSDCPVPPSLRFDPTESAEAAPRHHSVTGDEWRQGIARHRRRGCSCRALSPCTGGQLPVGARRAAWNTRRRQPTRSGETARWRKQGCQSAGVDMTLSPPELQQMEPDPKQWCILRPVRLDCPAGRCTPLDAKHAIVRHQVKDGTAHRNAEGFHGPEHDIAVGRASMKA